MSNISYSQFTRTTLSQAAMRVNGNLSRITRQLVDLQEKMATGKALNRPSDDPFGTVLALQLQTLLENKVQYKENVRLASDALAATDRALGDISEVLVEARTTGLGEIGATATDETRQAAALVIDSVLDEVLSRANATFNERYLFAGTLTGAAPFEAVGDAIAFNGNNETLTTRIDRLTDVEYNVTSDDVFGTRSSLITGFQDLSATIELDTDLRAMNDGRGVHAGSIIIDDGTTSSTVDLSHAQTIGDVVDAINDATPVTTTCSVNGPGAGLVITSTLPGADITIVEASQGSTAEDLGIYRPTAGGGDTVTGDSLDPVLQLNTKLSLLYDGTGIDTSSGLTLSNGDYAATLTFDDCETVEDLINKIKGAGVYVEAAIAEDGRRLELVSRLHGAELRVAETTGQTATDLGLRSLAAGTRLSSLNQHGGVRTDDGDDVRFTCRNGDTMDVDLSEAITVQDVIDAINNDADNAGRVLARLALSGNGIELVDQTVDAGVTFSVGDLGNSFAAADLGIAKAAAPGGDTITGDDTNGLRNESVFTHLMDLREALLSGESAAMTTALERLDVDYTDVLSGRGEAGTKGRRMEMLSDRIDAEVLDAQDYLSRTQDLDIATTIVEYTTLQAAMEACLKTASTVVGLSLLDFL